MSDRYRKLETLTAQQQIVYDDIAVPRKGVVPAPFHVLLESPELATLVQALGSFIRYRTDFPPPLSELLILITAKHWQVDYAVAVHSREALAAGIPLSVIDALRSGARPEFEDSESEILYEFATTFFRTNDVPDDLFERAVSMFGRTGAVELAGIIGYYSSIAILLRIFRVPAEIADAPGIA